MPPPQTPPHWEGGTPSPNHTALGAFGASILAPAALGHSAIFGLRRSTLAPLQILDPPLVLAFRESIQQTR